VLSRTSGHRLLDVRPVSTADLDPLSPVLEGILPCLSQSQDDLEDSLHALEEFLDDLEESPPRRFRSKSCRSDSVEDTERLARRRQGRAAPVEGGLASSSRRKQVLSRAGEDLNGAKQDVEGRLEDRSDAEAGTSEKLQDRGCFLEDVEGLLQVIEGLLHVVERLGAVLF
jgi:hypothetical protein